MDRPLGYRNMSEDSLTIVAPKIEKKEALEKTKSTKIEIKIGESKSAKLKDNVEDETTEYRKVPTPLAIESMKKEEPVEEAKYSMFRLARSGLQETFHTKQSDSRALCHSNCLLFSELN